jgi:transposase
MDAKDRQIAKQGRQIKALKKQVADLITLLQAEREEKVQLLAKIAALEKNSSNSSKPPSSDIVKPQKPKLKDKDGKEIKRKIGAQPGHKQNLRKPIAPELIDEVIKLELTNCPDCGQKLSLDKIEPKKTQHIELVEKPVIITEYQQLMYWCKKCKCYHYSRLPEEIEKAGLFGNNMTALTAYLKGRMHASYRTLKEYFHDVVGIDISTGFLAKQIKKVAAALKSPYEELEAFLKEQEHLYIDETSFKKNGKLQWAWCFVAEFFTFFKIDASRGSKVLYDTLGDDFLGSISSDFYSAYLKYKKETETLFQFCWAHLIREIKFLATLDDTKTYGNRLLKYVKAMFADIHRQDELTEIGFKRLMNKHKKAIMKTVRRSVPEHNKAAALSKRFAEHGESYFLFVKDPQNVVATNNFAEHGIRTLVLDRIVTQGVRSVVGNEWHERFWTTLATCRRLGWNVMSFLREAISAAAHGRSTPSLLSAIAVK